MSGTMKTLSSGQAAVYPLPSTLRSLPGPTKQYSRENSSGSSGPASPGSHASRTGNNGPAPRPGPASPPGHAPRTPGQRCLPETPKGAGSSAAAVPPIYANVEQQLAAGNSRQLSPTIARILEDSGNKRGEPGPAQPGPPAIPKPAARMSVRQKVTSPSVG